LEKENIEMIQRYRLFILGILFFGLLLPGCLKRVPEPIPSEKVSVENPIIKLLDAFSSAESLQARTSIRIETVRMGGEMNFLLNGFLLYQKPGRLRLIGYHPLGMGLFDALYRDGEFFLLIPFQKRAYTGEVSQFEGIINKAGPIEFSSAKPEGSDIPNWIRIEAVEKETRIEFKLKEILINPILSEDSFQWVVPEGVEVEPIAQFLKGKKL
jgi:outer membrane lipoprotein-sorting protein